MEQQQTQFNYKDIVIEQLSFRIADLENFAKKLVQENEQLRKELSEATIKED